MCVPGCPADGWIHRRHLKKLRRDCRKRLAALNIPALPDMSALCALLGRRTGRPLHLLPMELHTTGIFGLWLRADDVDFIAYERHTSAAHQSHIIAHELSHMLCDHHHGDTATETPAELFANLDPALVKDMLMRCGYSQQAEQEAEVMASLLLLSLDARPEPSPQADASAPGHKEVLARIEEAIGLKENRRPHPAGAEDHRDDPT